MSTHEDREALRARARARRLSRPIIPDELGLNRPPRFWPTIGRILGLALLMLAGAGAVWALMHLAQELTR